MTVLFTLNDAQNFELARHVIFRRLQEDQNWTQMDYRWDPQQVDKYIKFQHPVARSAFQLLASEVMWQLIMLNVITPGLNPSNPNLPFFRVTAYGEQVLREGRFNAHDPTRYLDEVRAHAQITIQEPVFSYLEEALRCFNAGCNTASVLLLGIAAESIISQLFDALRTNLFDDKEREMCSRLKHIKQKHDWIILKLNGIPKKIRNEKFSNHIDIVIPALYNLFRQQRNELGHPQNETPNVNREEGFVYFRLFPSIVGSVEEMAAFARENQI